MYPMTIYALILYSVVGPPTSRVGALAKTQPNCQ